MADLMRSLVHLEPPRLVPLALDRFSPYHERPEAFGLIPLGPRRDYALIHPTLDAATRRRSPTRSSTATPTGASPRPTCAPCGRSSRPGASSETAFGSLRYRRHRRGLTVTDRRPGLPPPSTSSAGPKRRRTWRARTARRWPGWTPRSRGGPRSVRRRARGFLDECVAARLVHRDGPHYLALALPRRPAPLGLTAASAPPPAQATAAARRGEALSRPVGVRARTAARYAVANSRRPPAAASAGAGRNVTRVRRRGTAGPFSSAGSRRHAAMSWARTTRRGAASPSAGVTRRW